MATYRMPVEITWTQASGSPGANIWHVRTTGSVGDSGEAQGLSDIVRDFYTAIQGFFPSPVNISFNGEFQGVGDDTGSSAITTPWGIDGTADPEFLPPANCLLAAWGTSGGGRSGRGRTFIGPLGTGNAEDNGTPVEAARSELLAAMEDLIESSDSFANGAVGIYSRTQDVFRDVVSAKVPNYFAVLRSRRD